MLTKTNQRRWCTMTLTSLFAALVLLATGCSDQEPAVTEEVVTIETPAVETPEPAPAAEPAAAEAETPEPAAEVTAIEAETPEPAAEAPTAEVEETQVAVAAGAGEAVYEKACKACHAMGVAGAPKTGDKEAWAPRIEKGNDALFGSVKNGFNAMPPMGGCMTCSDEELRSAVAYLVSQGS
jgi:cytochrome c5